MYSMRETLQHLPVRSGLRVQEQGGGHGPRSALLPHQQKVPEIVRQQGEAARAPEPPAATEPAAAPAIGRTAAEQCLSGGTSLSVADEDACDWAATAAQ